MVHGNKKRDTTVYTEIGTKCNMSLKNILLESKACCADFISEIGAAFVS